MNIMRKIFLTVLLVAFASAAFAEGTPKKPSVAGFVSNGFWDNWEISAGFGTGTAFSNGGNSGSWGDRFGFEGNLSVTKWLHPVFGMRAQLQRMVQQFRFPDRQDDVAVHVRTRGFHG